MPGMKVLSSSPPAHRDFRLRFRSLGLELDPFPAAEEPRLSGDESREGGATGAPKDIAAGGGAGAEKEPAPENGVSCRHNHNGISQLRQ